MVKPEIFSSLSGQDVTIVMVPTLVTILIAFVGVLWKSGVDKGREAQRESDTERRITRIENKLFPDRRFGSDD